MDNAEAVLAPYYAGDAAAMIKNNPNIGFVIPEEGTNRFIDSMCIPKNSKNKELAEKYINFMCRTDIAIANVKKTGYSTPHSEAYNLLDDEIKNSPIFYPDENIIEKSQIFINLPEDINKYIDELWVEVKSGGTSENSWFLFVFLVCFGIIYLSIFLCKKKKIKKN